MTSSMLIMASAGHGLWYEDPRFFILLSLMVFFGVLIWKGAHKAMAASLDARAETIKNDLEEARRLREEAQALLASYHRKQSEAETLAEEIVAQARKDAEAMAVQSRADLATRLERRTQMAEEKIAIAEVQAMADVRARAADMAVAATESILKSKMKSADHGKLIAEGIKQLGRAF